MTVTAVLRLRVGAPTAYPTRKATKAPTQATLSAPTAHRKAVNRAHRIIPTAAPQPKPRALRQTRRTITTARNSPPAPTAIRRLQHSRSRRETSAVRLNRILLLRLSHRRILQAVRRKAALRNNPRPTALQVRRQTAVFPKPVPTRRPQNNNHCFLLNMRFFQRKTGKPLFPNNPKDRSHLFTVGPFSACNMPCFTLQCPSSNQYAPKPKGAL